MTSEGGSGGAGGGGNNNKAYLVLHQCPFWVSRLLMAALLTCQLLLQLQEQLLVQVCPICRLLHPEEPH